MSTVKSSFQIPEGILGISSILYAFLSSFVPLMAINVTCFGFLRTLRPCRSITGILSRGKILMLLLDDLITSCDFSTRHLGCEPATIDAKYFSPQNRRRLFWGNIPGLFTVSSMQGSSDGEAWTLDKSLMPNSGRKATQRKIRTLTTNTNSLLQGRTENCSNRREITSLFPVRFVSQGPEGPRQESSTSKSKAHKRKPPDDVPTNTTVVTISYQCKRTSLNNLYRKTMLMTLRRRMFCGSRK